jgi:serine/threonine-protein kinase
MRPLDAGDSHGVTLASGARLGPYEVLSSLGTGGMGEVYRARDARLHRVVAIKVLRSLGAADPERRARFEREARAISRLNHPHICTIHDIGHQDGTDYLVLELVEGETLAERLQRGPLSNHEILRYGEQIADALFAAHRHGIVHRDLKPGNVMVTRSGVKLLDFGLAKLRADNERRPDTLTSSEDPTLTRDGSVLGTLQYMAPEQLEGREVDARADLWALGCVLYEMATSRRAFESTSRASLAAAILEKEPAPLGSLQPQLPRAFERLVQRCLAKDPDERWQNAGDLAFGLRSALGAPADGVPPPQAPPGRDRVAWAVAVGAGLFALATLVWGMARRAPAKASRFARFTIPLPTGDRLPTAMHPVLALSRDGTLLAYVGERAGASQLYLRRLDALTAEPIPGTGGARAPFFSPDGRWLGFFADRKLKKVPVGGGAVATLADAPDPWGGTWTDDDTIVFNRSGFTGLSRVAAAGGTPTVLTVPKASSELEHEWPHALPGGKAIVFSAMSAGAFDSARIMALSRDGAAARPLIEGGFAPRFLPTGHLLYARRRGLYAVRFDPSRLETAGTPVRVMEGALTALTGATHAAVADDGTLAYVPGSPDRRAMRIDRSGARAALLDKGGLYSDAALSPDGTRLALSIEGEKTFDIWVADLERGTLARLTSEGMLNAFPTWSPDGKRIAFFSARAGETNKVYWQPADGSGPAERLTSGDSLHWPDAFSPDGRLLVWGEGHPESGPDLWVLPLDGERRSRPLLRTPFAEHGVAFSPDGRYFAYVSDQTGREEVYVQALDVPGAGWPISTDGGGEPRWVSGEILYRNGDRIMSAAVRTQPTFSADRPRLRLEGWFEPCAIPLCRSFDVSRDGRDLIVLTGDQLGPPTEIHVVLGWFRELEAALSGPSSADAR